MDDESGFVGVLQGKKHQKSTILLISKCCQKTSLDDIKKGKVSNHTSFMHVVLTDANNTNSIYTSLLNQRK